MATHKESLYAFFQQTKIISKDGRRFDVGATEGGQVSGNRGITGKIERKGLIIY
jgi:hypothetical protein